MSSLASALASRDADAIADALDESAGLSDETVHDLRAAAREVMRRMRVERDASTDLRLALATGEREDLIAALARVEQVGGMLGKSHDAVEARRRLANRPPLIADHPSPPPAAVPEEHSPPATSEREDIVATIADLQVQLRDLRAARVASTPPQSASSMAEPEANGRPSVDLLDEAGPPPPPPPSTPRPPASIGSENGAEPRHPPSVVEAAEAMPAPAVAPAPQPPSEARGFLARQAMFVSGHRAAGGAAPPLLALQDSTVPAFSPLKASSAPSSSSSSSRPAGSQDKVKVGGAVLQRGAGDRWTVRSRASSLLQKPAPDAPGQPMEGSVAASEMARRASHTQGARMLDSDRWGERRDSHSTALETSAVSPAGHAAAAAVASAADLQALRASALAVVAAARADPRTAASPKPWRQSPARGTPSIASTPPTPATQPAATGTPAEQPQSEQRRSPEQTLARSRAILAEVREAHSRMDRRAAVAGSPLLGIMMAGASPIAPSAGSESRLHYDPLGPESEEGYAGEQASMSNSVVDGMSVSDSLLAEAAWLATESSRALDQHTSPAGGAPSLPSVAGPASAPGLPGSTPLVLHEHGRASRGAHPSTSARRHSREPATASAAGSPSRSAAVNQQAHLQGPTRRLTKKEMLETTSRLHHSQTLASHVRAAQTAALHGRALDPNVRLPPPSPSLRAREASDARRGVRSPGGQRPSRAAQMLRAMSSEQEHAAGQAHRGVPSSPEPQMHEERLEVTSRMLASRPRENGRALMREGATAPSDAADMIERHGAPVGPVQPRKMPPPPPAAEATTARLRLLVRRHTPANTTGPPSPLDRVAKAAARRESSPTYSLSSPPRGHRA